ncbi:MAG TPA: response regulator [Flavisolibacter sp.]|jgi:CheY-like chemotaxis protein|nr:response regulator [Flavisolibacter sp.]
MKSRYIIFADDDADDMELITGFFKQYNRDINVLEFKDGKEVLKFLDELAFNATPLLIVLDINMPRLNGKETLVAIRNHARYQYIPVVIYTTSTSKTDEDFCRHLGASWVSKSTTIEGVKQVAKVLAEFCDLQNVH